MDRIERIKVESSNIESIGYDEESKTLIVEFKSGSTYSYIGVPSIVFKKMLESDSKGKFLNNNIKPVFLATKLKLLESNEIEKVIEQKQPLVQEDKVVEQKTEGFGVEEKGVNAEINSLKNRVIKLEIEFNLLKDLFKSTKSESTDTKRRFNKGRILVGN